MDRQSAVQSVQAHPDFTFHLDEPLEQPTAHDVPLRGWVTAEQPIDEVRLCGARLRALASEERRDVQIAFPAAPFVAGFNGTVSPADLRHGALHFEFGAGQIAVQPLPAPPPRAPRLVRMWRRLLALLANARSRVTRDPCARWHFALRALLLDIGRERNGEFRRREIDRVLACFADHMPDAVVVQIGANDGASGDPLAHLFARTQWTGILVEPVPFLCKELVRKYDGRSGIHVEQVAISDRDGDAALYRLRTIAGETPEWFNQLATLDRAVLLKHRSSIPQIDSMIVEERTPTARLETLLARHGLQRVDLLVIDTEGHDYQILRQVDLARFQPLLIVFEHQHLQPGDKTEAHDLLRRHGYDVVETGEGDSLAWRLQ